ncbi:hypothetical protein T10_5000 [Trichinella papuae]|uniref:Uncharacterized protein n=1 Tax=Trichinella papuae TaxID=268474 RepID=A0A0V1M169_9BILA|nr:hypothetical protein T10_5000 [Trichinella papuae]
MDNLHHRRAAQVRWLKAAIENMVAAVNVCFVKLLDTWSRYEDITTKLLDNAEDKKEIDTLTEEREARSDSEWRKKDCDLLKEEHKTSKMTPIFHAGTSNVRLPKLEIKKFNGKYSDWQRFHDEFELFMIVATGSAAAAIQGLPLSPANYEAARIILSEKFGKRQVTIEEHLKHLQSLPVIINQWDVDRLNNVVSEMEIHIRGLEALNTSPVVDQAILIPLILPRLLREITVEWNGSHPDEENDIYELLSFLKSEIRSRERHTFPRQTKKESFAAPFPLKQKIKGQGKYTIAVFQISERMVTAKRLRLCFLCVRAGH